MIAGSDIGYCDSNYRENNTVDIFSYCEKSMRANLEKLGFEVGHIYLKENNLDLHLTDLDTRISYDFEDLDYDTYETFTREDFLREYDERFSPCCSADIYEDYGRCKHCKEAVI